MLRFAVLAVLLVGCRISKIEREAYQARLDRLEVEINQTSKAANREPNPRLREERQKAIAPIRKEWERGRQIGQLALDTKDRRGLEEAHRAFDNVEKKLYVLPR